MHRFPNIIVHNAGFSLESKAIKNTDEETGIKEGTEDNTQAFCKTSSPTI